MMTLKQVLAELIAKAEVVGYKQHAYVVQTARMRKLIALKGENCPVSAVSIEEVNNICVIDIYA
jgi:hypothetical protein